MRWEEVNLEESFIEKHTIFKWGTIRRIERIIELCKSSNNTPKERWLDINFE